MRKQATIFKITITIDNGIKFPEFTRIFKVYRQNFI